MLGALRMMRVVVLLLGCLLLFDAATPLLPGAFRFDPSESVEALHGSDRPRAHASVTLLHVAAVAAPPAPPALGDAVVRRPRPLPPRLDLRREAVGIHTHDDGATTDDD
jgi:hypothetical protein